MRRWLPLLLVPAVLLLFWPAVLQPTYILHPTFSPFSDTMVVHWPKAHLMAQNWRATGNLPYWTPLILSGMPLAANQLAMLFYPPAWLFLFLPLGTTFNLLFVFHLVLGGTGIFFLVHKGYGISAGAALLGGLTFALNSKWLAHAAGGHVSMVGAIGWMPWALFGVVMLLNEVTTPERGSVRRAGWVLLIAVALALQIVTHTLPLIYTTYLIGAGVVFFWIWIRREESEPAVPNSTLRVQPSKYRHQRSRALRFALFIRHQLSPLPLLMSAFGLAALLGAVQLIPLLELTPYSNRSLSLVQAAEYSVSPAQLLVGLLLPSAQGGHEYVIYLGLVPLLLIPFGIDRRKRWTWFYAGVLVFVILFALGPYTPLHSLFYYFIPGFRWVRTPARIFFVGAIAASVLVGFAIDRLNHARWSARAKVWGLRLALAGGLLASLLGLGLALMVEPVRRSALGLALIVPAGLILISLRVHRSLPIKRFTLLLGLLLLVDLAWFDLSMMRFVSPAEALAAGRPAAEYLAGRPGMFRVYSPSYSLPMQTAAVHNLHLADGVEPVHLAAYDQFMARAGGYHSTDYSVTIPHFGDAPLESALKDVEPNLKLLGLLNVEYLAAAFPMTWAGLSPESQLDETYIYTNRQALPRAWVAHQTLVIESDWITQLEGLPNLADVALIENGPYLTGSGHPATPVTITRFSANEITLQTDIARPGWLVLSEIWYPGWQAIVNGIPQPVEKVNGLLRGVYLAEPGQYTVAVVYRSQSVVLGSWISAITVLVVVLVGAGLWVRETY